MKRKSTPRTKHPGGLTQVQILRNHLLKHRQASATALEEMGIGTWRTPVGKLRDAGFPVAVLEDPSGIRLALLEDTHPAAIAMQETLAVRHSDLLWHYNVPIGDTRDPQAAEAALAKGTYLEQTGQVPSKSKSKQTLPFHVAFITRQIIRGGFGGRYGMQRSWNVQPMLVGRIALVAEDGAPALLVTEFESGVIWQVDVDRHGVAVIGLPYVERERVLEVLRAHLSAQNDTDFLFEDSLWPRIANKLTAGNAPVLAALYQEAP
ncbi:MAG: hypothetical protein ACPGO3_05665 [Magnetospiraceae bacterium]